MSYTSEKPSYQAQYDRMCQLFGYYIHYGNSYGAVQNPREWRDLDKMIERRRRFKKTNNIVEIGVYQGGTSWLLARHLEPGGRLVGVDVESMGAGDHARTIYAQLNEDGYDAHYLTMTSAAAFEHVEKMVPDGIDVLHIDADHAYEGVRFDFETYLPLMKPDGLIIFHDIRYIEDVTQLWERIDIDARRHEFFTKRHGFGLGLLELNRRYGPDENYYCSKPIVRKTVDIDAPVVGVTAGTGPLEPHVKLLAEQFTKLNDLPCVTLTDHVHWENVPTHPSWVKAWLFDFLPNAGRIVWMDADIFPAKPLGPLPDHPFAAVSDLDGALESETIGLPLMSIAKAYFNDGFFIASSECRQMFVELKRRAFGWPQGALWDQSWLNVLVPHFFGDWHRLPKTYNWLMKMGTPPDGTINEHYTFLPNREGLLLQRYEEA
jgi:predicted O-methyltransferase YrrM